MKLQGRRGGGRVDLGGGGRLGAQSVSVGRSASGPQRSLAAVLPPRRRAGPGAVPSTTRGPRPLPPPLSEAALAPVLGRAATTQGRVRGLSFRCSPGSESPEAGADRISREGEGNAAQRGRVTAPSHTAPGESPVRETRRGAGAWPRSGSAGWEALSREGVPLPGQPRGAPRALHLLADSAGSQAPPPPAHASEMGTRNPRSLRPGGLSTSAWCPGAVAGLPRHNGPHSVAWSLGGEALSSQAPRL